MLYSLIGLVMTAFLGYSLALGKFGLPKYGISGIGWSITISYLAQAIMMIIHVSYSRWKIQFNIFTPFKWISIYEIKKHWVAGWPIGVKHSIWFSLLFLLAIIIGALYPHELPVYQIIIQLVMFTTCLSSSIALGTRALLGQAIGRKDYSATKQIGIVSILLTIFSISSICIIYLVFNKWLSYYFFDNNSDAGYLFHKIILLVILFQVLDGARDAISNILITFKSTRIPLISDIIGYWVVSLLISYIVGINLNYGLSGFLVALIVGSITSISIMFFKKDSMRLIVSAK